MKRLRFGSLFSGVGGLDLGLEQAGHRCAFHVEADPFCRDVLARHWPGVPRFNDVRDVGAHNLPAVDMLVGGFPCQDVSSSGTRAGVGQGGRSGLWFEFARLISELHPSYVLIENVEALRHRGRGLDIVLHELSTRGYDARWDCLPAAAFGAPHLRERLFIFAWSRALADAKRLSRDDATHPSLFDCVPRKQHEPWQAKELLEPLTVCGVTYRGLPRRLRMDDGVPTGLDKANLTPKERRGLCAAVTDAPARIKACGNAVAPPVARHIGNCINQWIHV